VQGVLLYMFFFFLFLNDTNFRQLYVIPLNASSKEWVLKLDDTSEEIVLIGSSERLICFGSSNYLVRICSIFGSQLAVISIPGPLVTMSCYQNSLLVAYHSGTLRKNDQNINIKLIKFTGLSMESRDINAALGPESTLSWLGFSDVGTPAMMDSLGMLSLHPISCNLWIPFCDTTKEVSLKLSLLIKPSI
jgi:chromosome transmission fidelity protein 4